MFDWGDEPKLSKAKSHVPPKKQEDDDLGWG